MRKEIVFTRRREVSEEEPSRFGEKTKLTRRSLLRAVRLLAAKDAALGMIVDRYGPPPLWEREQGFPTLIHIVLEQQVSLQSARAAYNRLIAAVEPLTPLKFLELSDSRLKEIGFSRQKTAYGRYLASAIARRELDLEGLQSLDDDDVRSRLMAIKGIGSWTADIYLLMAMGRPDIWPGGDLALAGALQRVKQLSERPTLQQLSDMSQHWRPYRAVAARMLWHFYLSERAPK